MSNYTKKTGIIIQARMGSTRLPSKIMLEVLGRPMLSYQLERLKTLNYQVYLATTTEDRDDRVEQVAIENNLPFFRGSEANVLKRYYDCAFKNELDIIVRITSDCPFIEPSLIDQAVKHYLQMGDDNLYYSNTIQRTYPRGADFEVFSFKLLREAHDNATETGDREHVTPYIWKNKAGHVKIEQMTQKPNFSKFRLTLDTQEDFSLISKLITDYKAHQLPLDDISQIMAQNADLHHINGHIEQKKS